MALTVRRLMLIALCVMTLAALIGQTVLAVWIDRSNCRAAEQAIENSRTMWELLIQQNPGPEADAFQIELDARIPKAHCEGGTLRVDRADTEGGT